MQYPSSPFTRYFILAVRGTFRVSPILKAQQLDKLPKEQRDREIQRWRSRKQGIPTTSMVSPSDEVDQTNSNLRVSQFLGQAAVTPHGNNDTQGLSTPEMNRLRDWMLNGEGNSSTRRCAGEETTAANFLARPCPGQNLLDPTRIPSPGPFASQLTSDNAEELTPGSHRRSVSLVTL